MTSKELDGTRKPAKTRDPIRTRAKIVAAARTVFVENGLTGARTSEIASKADVPQGLLYHYFENKQGLFKAVMEEALEPYFRATIEMLASPRGETSLELLERCIRFHFDHLRNNPHVPRLMAWWTADQGWTEGFPLPDDKADLCMRPYELGSRRIREGQEAGMIRPHLDPIMIINSFINLNVSWHTNLGKYLRDSGIDPSNQEAVDRQHTTAVHQIVDLVLGGVAQEGMR